MKKAGERRADRLASFDLEIAKIVPQDGSDWWPLAPQAIACAGICVHRRAESTLPVVLWYGNAGRGVDASYAGSLTAYDCKCLVDALDKLQQGGFHIITWNGLSFDFRLLADECQDGAVAAVAAVLALDHIDIGFQMVCEKGYMIGLDAAARGMGLKGKLKGMTGAMAPILWAGYQDTEPGPEMRAAVSALGVLPGDREAQALVLKYLEQDAKATIQVYKAIVDRLRLDWVSRSGRDNTWNPTFVVDPVTGKLRLLTVREAMGLPKPNTSWMKSARPRSEYYSWLPM